MEIQTKERQRVERFSKMAKDTAVNLDKLYKFYYGDVCEPHDEECIKCSAYLVLKEFKRHFID